MAETNSTSVYGKIADLTIEDRSYTNKETGEIIEYKRIYAHVKLDGEDEVVELVPAKSEGKSAYKVLRLADDVE